MFGCPTPAVGVLESKECIVNLASGLQVVIAFSELRNQTRRKQSRNRRGGETKYRHSQGVPLNTHTRTRSAEKRSSQGLAPGRGGIKIRARGGRNLRSGVWYNSGRIGKTPRLREEAAGLSFFAVICPAPSAGCASMEQRQAWGCKNENATTNSV
nr:hypothetical protein CFP56_03810 [Quercus suber]